jgi:aryl-alcohol dehydrogenase-like predicted oxidoreductase
MGQTGVLKETLPTRVLGRTKVKVPVLGLGFGPIGTGLTESQAIELMEQALGLGVTYWDAAPTYARAQEYIGKVLPKVRDRVFLVSKVATDDAKRALEIIEGSLRTMKTDCIDLVHVHNIGDFKPDRVLGKGGVLEGLREAQKRGWVRFIGVSGHYRPSVMAKVLDSGEFDVVMCLLNFVDRFTYDFEGKVLPIARKHNVGVVAMKVMAAPQKGYGKPNPGRLADYADLAIRYSLSLPEVACAVVGVFSVDELKQNVAIAKSRKSLTKFELQRLASIGKELAQRWGAHYGDPT